MQVRVKLMGMLKSKTPAGGVVTLPTQATIRDLANQLEISPDSIQVTTLNGAIKRDWDLVLSENDEVSLIPPVGGG